MTRRSSESGRVTPSGDDGPENSGTGYPSLRQRNPVAYWIAIISVAALVLGTIAGALSAIL